MKQMAILCWLIILFILATYAFALAPPSIKEMKRGVVILEVKVNNTLVEHNVQVASKRDFMIYLKKLIEQSL